MGIKLSSGRGMNHKQNKPKLHFSLKSNCLNIIKVVSQNNNAQHYESTVLYESFLVFFALSLSEAQSS